MFTGIRCLYSDCFSCLWELDVIHVHICSELDLRKQWTWASLSQLSTEKHLTNWDLMLHLQLCGGKLTKKCAFEEQTWVFCKSTVEDFIHHITQSPFHSNCRAENNVCFSKINFQLTYQCQAYPTPTVTGDSGLSFAPVVASICSWYLVVSIYLLLSTDFDSVLWFNFLFYIVVNFLSCLKCLCLHVFFFLLTYTHLPPIYSPTYLLVFLAMYMVHTLYQPRLV